LNQDRPHKRRDAHRVAAHEFRLRRHVVVLRADDKLDQLGAIMIRQRLGGGRRFGGGAAEGETWRIHDANKPPNRPPANPRGTNPPIDGVNRGFPWASFRDPTRPLPR
jgi:hypothetical protein